METRAKEAVVNKTEETVAEPLEAEKADIPAEAKPVAPAMTAPSVDAVAPSDLGIVTQSPAPAKPQATGEVRQELAKKKLPFHKADSLQKIK